MNRDELEGGEPNRTVCSTLLVSLAGGVAAALAAGVSMALLRWTLVVRTIPERVLEWSLLFISPDQFEGALLRFGFEAKRYALYAAVGGMLLLLATLGAFALGRRWSTSAFLALGIGLWLFTMLVIMPLTDAGFFAVDLVDGTGAAIGGYLAVALTYAATLSVVGAWRQHPAFTMRDTLAAESHPPSRRSAVLLTSGALASFVGTFLLAHWGPRGSGPARIVVADPQAPWPSGGIDPPKPHPNLVTTPETGALPRQEASPGAGSGADARAAGASAAATPPEQSAGPDELPLDTPAESVQSSFPEPPPSVQLTRDPDGSVLPSGRRPGDVAALITGNNDFYIVTKNAGGDPSLRAADWRLRIDGDVQRPVELDYTSLRNLPSVEVTKTLECISNFVDKCELAPFGCDLISTARWKGVPLGSILELAGGLRPDVVSLSTVSADEFTTSLPLDVVLDPGTLLVYEMNGQVLPREHGYPARILVPGRYGMKSAKWVVTLRPLRREFTDWYGQRQWSKEGIVKTMTRIDTPARDAELPPGEHRIAGIAYAGDRGIVQVEFSADDGMTWQIAKLQEPAPGQDAWVRWEGQFTLQPEAELTLVSRATDGTGEVQSEAFTLPQPDGSSGWHHVMVRATSS
jgi:DMSO/TMAO reductase YedYZ molybdopterin-dependent catalytic subunit